LEYFCRYWKALFFIFKEADHSELIQITINGPLNKEKMSQHVLTLTSQNEEISIPLTRVKRKTPDPVLLVMTSNGLAKDHYEELEVTFK